MWKSLGPTVICNTVVHLSLPALSQTRSMHSAFPTSMMETSTELRYVKKLWSMVNVTLLPHSYSYLPCQLTPCVPVWSPVPTQCSFSLWLWSKQQSRLPCWKHRTKTVNICPKSSQNKPFNVMFLCFSVKSQPTMCLQLQCSFLITLHSIYKLTVSMSGSA